MRTIRFASVVLILVAGQAVAQTSVEFELELGGDNHGADCVAPGTEFTPGDPNDSQPFTQGSLVTWDTRIFATGQHEVDSTWYWTPGVANFVFDLELHIGTAEGPLAELAHFESTVNDGNDSCPLTSGAFAFSFDSLGFGGWGRVIDRPYPSECGLRMGNTGDPWFACREEGDTTHKPAFNYPTTPKMVEWHVPCQYATAYGGKAIGMGAGYHEWNRPAYPNWQSLTVAGLGQTSSALEGERDYGPGDPDWGHMGTGPVCEGQIDTTNLDLGTYVLKLIPGSGINVLRGDKNLSQTQAGFWAIPADQTVGDTITFDVVLADTCSITAWASVRDHDGTDLEIVLDASASGSAVVSETRQGGVQKIEVDVSATGSIALAGTIQAVGGGGAGGSIPATNQQLIDNGGGSYTVVAEWNPGLPDEDCYQIDLASNLACLIGDTDCMVRGLAGDTNGGGSTDLVDMAQVKSMNGEDPTLPGNARFDVNVGGTIDLVDAALVKSLNGGSATCP